MPEIVHDCGKRVRFPSGTEGKKGRCPHCQGTVIVPHEAVNQRKLHLTPPPHWDEYLAYLEDRGPPPTHMVMPSRLMLQDEFAERWERRKEVVYSKFYCPSCRERIIMKEVICTNCGLDFRSGEILGKPHLRLNKKGMEYLGQISWVKNAREESQRLRKKSSGEHVLPPSLEEPGDEAPAGAEA